MEVVIVHVHLFVTSVAKYAEKNVRNLTINIRTYVYTVVLDASIIFFLFY